MRIDDSAAEQFLSLVDGARSLADVWAHPAYDIARTHATLLGRDLSRDDVSRALDGEETAFRYVENLDEHREEIASLQTYVTEREDDWVEEIERQLARITPPEDLSDLPVYLAIGYEFGIGTSDGAYVNLNEPLFFDMPRQLLYTAIHESSHVIYDRVHEFSSRLGPADLADRAGQQRVFETLFHTEAFATYTPLALRRADGNLGEAEHLVCSDYRILGDEQRLQELVMEYDSFRETLRTERVEPSILLKKVFGSPRLPYRVGCAMLDHLEERRGIEAVRDAFYQDPGTFLTDHDAILDRYRQRT